MGVRVLGFGVKGVRVWVQGFEVSRIEVGSCDW